MTAKQEAAVVELNYLWKSRRLIRLCPKRAKVSAQGELNHGTLRLNVSFFLLVEIKGYLYRGIGRTYVSLPGRAGVLPVLIRSV